MASRKTGARKTGSARKTATADVPVASTGRPSDTEARRTARGTGVDATVEPPTAAQRAQPHVTGTELGTSSGPQEKGPTRGARRPYTEVLPGFARQESVVRVPTADEESYEQRRKRAEDKAAEDKKNLLPVTAEHVVATRMGFYGGGRQPAGKEFVIRLRKGETLPSWVVKKGDYDAEVRRQAGIAPLTAEEPTRRGARSARKTAETRAADRSASESGDGTATATLEKDEDK